MTTRILLKSAGVLLAVAVVALVATDYLTSRVVAMIYMADHQRELERTAHTVAGAGIDATRINSMASAAGARVTLFGSDGHVVADSGSGARDGEDSATRPEVREALSGRVGRDIRKDSQGGRYSYVAIPVSAGVLRISTSYATVEREVEVIRTRVLESTALGFLPAMMIALLIAQRISTRLGSIIGFAGELANGNFHSRLPSYRAGELAHLGRKLNETSEKLERTVQQQLQTEHTELEKLERIRKDFVINVSHELRTPLASIQGYAETLIDGAIHDEANNLRFLGIIRHNAERLALLTADLLSLSRIEMKTQKFRFSFYRVNELLRDVLDTIRPIADKKEIELRQELAPAGTEVFCDSEAVYQILSNLIDNAVKYTPEQGNITVGAAMMPEESGPRMLELFVRDTGIGIPPEDQPRLFERFYRVDKARSRELGGTGLGLAIVKHLVRTHGGDVRVRSQLNEGSTFYFTLPLERRESDPGQIEAQAMPDAVTPA